MRSEKELISKVFTVARLIDNRPKDQRYYEGVFFDLLWVLQAEEPFRKALLPETLVRSATGKTTSRKNYQKTLEKVFSTQKELK